MISCSSLSVIFFLRPPIPFRVGSLPVAFTVFNSFAGRPMLTSNSSHRLRNAALCSSLPSGSSLYRTSSADWRFGDSVVFVLLGVSAPTVAAAEPLARRLEFWRDFFTTAPPVEKACWGGSTTLSRGMRCH